MQMTTVTLKDAKNRLSALTRLAEAGEPVVITRNGAPVAELIAHRPRKGLDFEAGEAFLRAHGVTRGFSYIAEDFDDPLPEDFLITPLPD